jgi:hypothetical protein
MRDLQTARYESALRSALSYNRFIRICRDIVDSSSFVRIDKKAVDAYAASLRVPDYVPGWDDYVTPRNKSLWARTDDFIELAASTVINAGYFYRGDDGSTQKWELNGSGSAALMERMAIARARNAIPAVHLKDPAEIDARLSDLFNGASFADRRYAIWAEMATPKVAQGLRDILYRTRKTTRSKEHHFTFDHIRALADLMPQGFGEDPFLKKAALLPILFAGLAHNKIGPNSVTMEKFCAADYRVPQTDHNIGLLRLHDDVISCVESQNLLHESSAMVTDIRASSWVINDMILTTRPDLQAHHLDGEKWFAGRLFDKPMDQLDEKKQKLRAIFEKIGQESGFNEKAFMRKANLSIAVPTMRF